MDDGRKTESSHVEPQQDQPRNGGDDKRGESTNDRWLAHEVGDRRRDYDQVDQAGEEGNDCIGCICLNETRKTNAA